MKKKFFLLGLGCMACICLFAQVNFSIKIYAGSNASWGEGQFVSIDAKGNGRYELSEVNKAVKDTISFVVTRAQLAQIEEMLNAIKFYQLKTFYNQQSRDGTRLSVEVTRAGKVNTVHWINIHTKESDAFLEKLNAILKEKGITLHY